MLPDRVSADTSQSSAAHPVGTPCQWFAISPLACCTAQSGTPIHEVVIKRHSTVANNCSMELQTASPRTIYDADWTAASYDHGGPPAWRTGMLYEPALETWSECPEDMQSPDWKEKVVGLSSFPIMPSIWHESLVEGPLAHVQALPSPSEADNETKDFYINDTQEIQPPFEELRECSGVWAMECAMWRNKQRPPNMPHVVASSNQKDRTCFNSRGFRECSL